MQSDPTGPRRWLKVAEDAAQLNLGTSTLNKLRITGGDPRYAKCLAAVIYDVNDLDDWAEARKIRSTSEPVRAG